MARSRYMVESWVLDGEPYDSGYGVRHSYYMFTGDGDSLAEVLSSCEGSTMGDDGEEGPWIALADLPADLCVLVTQDIRRQFALNNWPLEDNAAECDRTSEDGSDREYPGGDL